MMPEAIRPLVRRAILDLLFDVGGEHNDDYLTVLLKQLGHRVARDDVAEQLRWLGDQGYVALDLVGPFLTARILSKGRDIADGSKVVEGVWRHKTGD